MAGSTGAPSTAASSADGVRPAQGLEAEVLDVRPPGQLGQQRAQRVAPVQVVAPVGDDERDRGRRRRPGQERDQVAGRAVGPVRVLDDQEDGATPGQVGQHAAHGLERRGLAGELVGPAADGEGRAEVLGLGTERGLRLLGAQALDEVGQRLDDRGVRHAAHVEVQAAAEQHLHVGGAGPLGQRGDEAGLADARVATEERDRAIASAAALDDALELGQLAGATHERRGAHAPDCRPVAAVCQTVGRRA